MTTTGRTPPAPRVDRVHSAGEPLLARIRPSPEYPSLDLEPVILQRIVQVNAGRVCRGLGLAIPDGTEDGIVLFDRGARVAADAAQANDADLALQQTSLANRRH